TLHEALRYLSQERGCLIFWASYIAVNVTALGVATAVWMYELLVKLNLVILTLMASVKREQAKFSHILVVETTYVIIAAYSFCFKGSMGKADENLKDHERKELDQERRLQLDEAENQCHKFYVGFLPIFHKTIAPILLSLIFRPLPARFRPSSDHQPQLSHHHDFHHIIIPTTQPSSSPPHPPPHHHLSSLLPSPPTPHTTSNTFINCHLKPLHLLTTITTPRQPRHPLHAISTAAPSSPHLHQYHYDHPIIIVTPIAA
nr:hypothetical protein [Tanacetum cinerariifolium]